MDGSKSKKEQILAAFKGKAIIHVASHGTYELNNPGSSTLEIGNESLSMRDVWAEGTTLGDTQLIVLSACRTGLVDVSGMKGNEFVGMAGGFILAGAKYVVSTLWSVGDLPTALLMSSFYRQLKNGDGVSSALRVAQIKLQNLSNADVVAYVKSCREISAEVSDKTSLDEELLYWKSRAKEDPHERPFSSPLHWAAFTATGAGAILGSPLEGV
jgi:CHAT domain-containing protein